ncbi:MAG: hypothetical protein WDM90_15060 [Ferruginibacter sp.]
MGARDLSIINTPPPNRQPIQTEVMVFNEDAIRDTIYYETDVADRFSSFTTV